MNWLRRWRRRLRPLFRARDAEREMDEEFRFHVEMEAQDLQRRGLTPNAARREAHRRFGGVERFKQQVRAQRWTRLGEDLVQDFRVALRNLLRRPVFAAGALITLALGIGANSAVFTAVKSAFLTPLPFSHPDRLVVLRETRPTGEAEPLSALNLRDYREASRTLGALAGWTKEDFHWTGRGEPEPLAVVRASTSLFDALGVTPILGRGFRPEDGNATEGRVAVLSYGFWQSRFGGAPDVLGRVLQLNDEPHTVVGVMPAGFRFPDDPGVSLWIPLYPRRHEARSRFVRNLEVVARLAPGVSVAQARAEVEEVAERLGEEYPRTNGGWGAELVSARSVLVGSHPVLLVLTGAVGFLLLIACVNLTNLLLAHFSERERELAVRSALGAGLGRLTRQFVAESLLLAALGGAGGIVLAALLLRAFRVLDPGYLPGWNPLALDATTLLFTGGISVAVALLAGVLPGLGVMLRRLPGGLSTSFRGAMSTSGSPTVRRGLVVVEVALAVVLLSGSALFIESLRRVLAEDSGLAAENVLTGRIELPGTRYREEEWAETFRAIHSEVSRTPGVRSAGMATTLPFMRVGTDYDVDLFMPRATAAEGESRADLRVVSPDYFRTLGIPLVVGRTFSARDRENSQLVAVVNQAFVRRYIGDADPLNRRVRLFFAQADPRRIVGTVADVRHRGLDREPRPEIFVPYTQLAHNDMILAVRVEDADPLDSLRAIEEAIWRVDPDLPLAHAAPLADLVDGSVADRRFHAALLTGLAVLGLTLASIGVYGIVAYAVRARTREIGLRMAVGATRQQLLGMVLDDGLRLALIGVAVGLAVALGLTRFLSGLLYEVSPSDPFTLGVVATVMITLAAVASAVAGWRAASLDPVRALRLE